MRKNAILFLIFSLVSVGLFFGLSGTVLATEASIPHNGHACIGNGPKTCEWAFPSVGNYQAWGSDWEFKYKRYGSGGAEGSVRQDVCVSKDAVLGNNDDVNCWVTIDRGWGTLPSQYTTISQIQHIGPANVVDAQYVVLKVSLNHADTESSFTVEERQVSTDTLNTGQTNFATLENVPITWATDWATLGGWLEITGQGQPVYETLFGVTAEQSKNGTFPISFKRRGTKTINLYASGPRVDGSSPPGGPQDSGVGPPYEVFIPRIANTAYAAGDGGTDSRTRNINILGGAVKVKSNLDNTTFGFVGAGTSFNGCPAMSVNAGQTWGCGLGLGGDHDIPAAQAGTNYTINPGSKTGYNVSVDDATQKVYDNQTTTFTISYTPIVQYGTVKVTSNVNNTDFGFGGTGAFGGCPSPMRVDIGGTWTCNTVEPGTHTINPENKTSEGYSDPPVVKNAAGQSGKETQTLSAGGTIEYNITYTAATGTISVTSNKNTNWNIDGPGSNDFSVTNDNIQNYNNVPLGTYTISGVPATIIADSGKWFSLNPITPDTTQTLSSSGQTKTFTIDYTQTQPVCSPATQSVQAGSPASFTATGGDGTFSWLVSPGGTPSSGMGSSFSTTYSATGSKTITVTSNQEQTDTCAVTVTSAPLPTVDLDANGSDGPISIVYNGSATLSWTSTNATSCAASGGWSGVKATSGSESTGSLTSDTTYTLTCDGPGGSASDSVTVTVLGLPTLSVGLTANPSTGSAPLSSVLSASVGGTATGTINYSFWWNCSNTSNSVAAVEGVCGTLPAPGAVSCASNAAGYKCNGVNANPQSSPAYSYNSSSTGKVIVERDIATPAEARASITISSPPPSASGVIVTPPNYCVSGPAATVSWTYSDPMGSPQSAYQVQIGKNGIYTGSNLKVDTGKTSSPSTAYSAGQGLLEFNTTYKARVMVWNSPAPGTPSLWAESSNFSTPNYAYPEVAFSFVPTSPPISEPVQFTDATTFYAPGPTTWSWLFGDAGSSVLQNPTHTYTTEGGYGATLTATDNAGHACSLTKTVNIQKAIPIWKEVAPR